MGRALRVFLSAGEYSGDRHGAALARELRRLEPGVELEGVGGPLMEAAGVTLHQDMVEHAAMGLLPVVKKLPFFVGALRDTAAIVRERRPDVVVPIDYPGFNLRLSRAAKRAGVKVCFYVSPQVWAWRPGRIHRIARLVDHMMVLFPFETELYREVGVPTTCVGHPLFDELRGQASTPGFRAGLGLAPEDPLVGLFPGSRRQEIERNLPVELEAARLMRQEVPGVQFALPVARGSLRGLVDELVGRFGEGLGVKVLEAQAGDVARTARVALCVSGTVTLELLHHDCPMVILYRTTRAQEALYRQLVVTPWVGLVNVLAQREVCPEHLGWTFTAADVAKDALALVKPGKARKQQLQRFRGLREAVDVRDRHEVAARTVLGVARGESAGVLGG